MRFLAALLLWFSPVSACETALLLLIDTSSSIDAGEYELQSDGTADAILDPEISDELVRGQVAMALMHWSGAGQSKMVMDWTQVRTYADPPRIAEAIRNAPRSFRGGSTATGFAIYSGVRAFETAPACERKIIDISTDGMRNVGSPEERSRKLAEDNGIRINGIAIESIGRPITSYLREKVATRGGFVLTSRFYTSYPKIIRAKILREISFAMM